MSGGARIWKVSYHNGSLSALVEAETPERAVEIAKAHREKKRLWSRKPPQSVLSDSYEVEPASARDIEWARSFGVGVLTRMPVKLRKGGVRSRKQPTGAREGAEAVTRPSGQFGEAA